jgi:hypothetical protein
MRDTVVTLDFRLTRRESRRFDPVIISVTGHGGWVA